MFCCLRACRYRSQARKSPSAQSRCSEPEIHLDPAHMGPDILLLSKRQRVTGKGGVLATAPLVQSKSYFEVKIQQTGCWSIGIATAQADLAARWGGCERESWCICSDNATRHNGEVHRPVIAACAPVSMSDIDKQSAPGLLSIEDLQEDLLLTTGNATPAADAAAAAALKTPDVLTSSVPQLPCGMQLLPDEGDVIGVAFDHIELNFYLNGKNLEVPFRSVKGAALFPVLYVDDGAVLDIILENFNYSPPAGFERIMIEQSLL